MKILTAAGWLLLAAETAFVLFLFATKNAGNDAAGRGVATGYAMVLAPIILVTAALLWWGSHGGPSFAFWLGFGIALLPVIFGVVTFANGKTAEAGYARERAQYGMFDGDTQLTDMARAIDDKDITKLRALMQSPAPDWTKRDRRDQTILGHAIDKAANDYDDDARVVPVRILLDAGAPPDSDVISPAKTDGSRNTDNLVTHLFNFRNKNSLAILDLVLAKGVSPNTVDRDGRPLYFGTSTARDALSMLAKYHADFTRLDTRTDRPGWNALMNAVYLKQWASAQFFLEQGLSPDFAAPDGKTARTILAEVDPAGTKYYGPEEPAHDEFIAEWNKHPHK